MYQIISEDVTLFDGDAILNSLGCGEDRIVSVPGGIFRSILKRVNDPDALREVVFDKGARLPVTSAFETKSYGLNCKHIIHAVPPFRYQDDDGLTLLKRTYQNVLELAYSMGIRSICLPLIGTGANDYSSGDSFRAAKEIAYAFGESHKDFYVYLTVFWGTKRAEARRREHELDEPYECLRSPSIEEGGWAEREYEERRRRGPTPQIGVPIPARLIDMSSLDLKVGDSFGRLIDLFLIAAAGSDSDQVLQEGWRKISESISGAREDFDEDEDHMVKGANFKSIWHKHPDYRKKAKGKKTKSTSKDKTKRGEEDPNGIWSVPGKLQILLTACALDMTKRQTEFLFKFCGYYLSKYRVEDLAIKACFQCLAVEGGDAANLDVYMIYYEKTGKMPFVKRKDPWKEPK